MKRKLEEAARLRMLAEETRLQKWRRVGHEKIKGGWQSMKNILLRVCKATWTFIKEKVPVVCAGIWKGLWGGWGIVLALLAIAGLIYLLGVYIYEYETREYLVISEDQCWIVNGVTRSSNGGAYFDTHAGRLYITDWQLIRLDKDDEDHNYTEATRVLGYPDFDIDTCYRDPED